MSDDGGHLLRWCRAVVLAVVAVQLGSFAHVTAGGLMPGPGALAVLTAGTVLLCAATLGVRRSAWRVVGLLVLGQAVVHGALSLTAGHRGDPPAGHAGHPASAPAFVPPDLPTGDDRRGATFQELVHVTGPSGTADGGPTLPAPVAHLVEDLTSHPLMALAHVVAAVLVGAWLAWGERALWRLLLRLVSVVPVAVRVLLATLGLRPPAYAPPTRPVLADAPPCSHRARHLLSASQALVRRGPPAARPV